MVPLADVRAGAKSHREFSWEFAQELTSRIAATGRFSPLAQCPKLAGGRFFATAPNPDVRNGRDESKLDLTQIRSRRAFPK